MSDHRVEGGGDTTLWAGRWGRPGGQAILFVHGFAQAHLSWLRQLEDPALAARFDMAALDLRGHGASDKPEDPGAYVDGDLWAEDLRAVIEATGLTRPVLVGWSYAGYLLCDYVRRFGDDDIAGLVFVGASTRRRATAAESHPPPPAGSRAALFQGMMAKDLATRIAANHGFLADCTAHALPDASVAEMLAYNMLCPVASRRAMMAREVTHDAVLAGLSVPTLVIHGAEDAIVSPSEGVHTASLAPGARHLIYPGVGHAPFLEAAPRFNRDLIRFMESTHP